MRCVFFLLLATCAVMQFGCGGGNAPPPAHGQHENPYGFMAGPAQTSASAQPQSARERQPGDRGKTDIPDLGAIAPAGAQYTIFCQVIPGPDHVERANRVKQQLLASSSMRDWYVLHQEGQSALYYGFYRSFDDPKDADTRRAQADRRAIDAMVDQLGNRPFKYAFFVAMDSPDPVAPPEWNLANAPGAYSLQIAAYTGNALRKQAAVDSVRAARQAGIEAYYYHGENISSVCVGTWPEGALRQQKVVVNDTGDPEQPVMNTTIPLPDEVARQQRDSQNRPIRVEQEQTEILDPSLLAMMRQFPVHAVNGEQVMTSVTDPTTGQTSTRPAPSFIVPIPHTAGSILSSPQPSPEPVRPPQPPPQQQTQPGVGKLKSVGQ